MSKTSAYPKFFVHHALVVAILVCSTFFSPIKTMADSPVSSKAHSEIPKEIPKEIHSADLKDDNEITLLLQTESLERLERELLNAKSERRGWITLTVLSSVAAVITAIPGVIVSYNGVKNVFNGRAFLGDPDSGGSLLVPMVIVTSSISAGSGVGAYQSFQKISIKTSQINQLLEKISAKKIEIENTLKLISVTNQM